MVEGVGLKEGGGLELFFDDGKAAGDFVLAAQAGFAGEGFEGVDVVEVDAFDVVDAGVDVAGDGDIDDEEGAAAAAAEGGEDLLGVDDGVRGGGGADDDVDVGGVGGPVFEGDGAAVHFLGEFEGALVAAVGDDDAFGAAALEALGAAAAHVAGAEEHDVAVAEVAEDFFGEFDGDGADGGRAALDLGIVADGLADAEGFLEEFIEEAGGGAGGVGGGVGVFDLAEDFGFAEDHGVEAGGEGEEVAGGVFAVVVEEVDIWGEVEAVAEPGIDLGDGGGGGGRGGVDLHAVAGGDDDRFVDVGELHQGLEGVG